MPFDLGPDDRPERPCEHTRRIPLAFDHPVVLEIKAQHPELFEPPLSPTGGYWCPDCELYWLVFPLL